MNATWSVPRRLVHITTVPESLEFVAGHASVLRARGWDVHAVSSPHERLHRYGEREGMTVHPIEMPRRITPVQDLGTVSKLTRLLRRLRPTVVHAHTPKGGLLGMIAATAARVPVRIYHMHGLPMETTQGARRQLLRRTEWTSCALSHQVLCQSRSLRARAISEGLCAPSKCDILLNGSTGVDANHLFHPARSAEARAVLRAELGIADDAPVVGFVGRLVKDKGIVELEAAWRRVKERAPRARLVLIGPFESMDPIPHATRASLETDPSVHLVGFRADVERWYAMMDLLVLPSHREGFPTSPLEAAAMEVPVVATRATGCVDAVEDRVTGLLVPIAAPAELSAAILSYLEEPELLRTHGKAARARVLKGYQRQQMAEATADRYEALLERLGISA